MASPDAFLSATALIPGLGSPTSSNASPMPGSPPSPSTPGEHPSFPVRSRTAPPPLAAPERDYDDEGDSASSSPLEDGQATIPPPLQPNGAPLIPHTHDALGLINADGTSSTPVYPSSALRRTSSSLSATSNGGNSASGSREKKRLRFTPLVGASDSPLHGHGHSHGHGHGHGGRYYDEERGVPKDQLQYLRSDPGTPNLSETADQIRRTLSLASLDALLAISANPSGERDRLLKEVSKAGKDLVWRDKHEKKLFPSDSERAIVLAAKRGLRSLLLGFSVRAGINVLLVLFRTMRKGKLRFALIRHAIFGQEPFRFGAMIGTFTFLNTLTLHLLRLAPPLSYIRRRIRAGIFSRASFGPPEREGAEGERRWQAAVAGAIGSLGLLWETKGRRTGVAQQMFVRGLQGAYNQYTPRFGIHIPNGDIVLFGLCCGQIMFAFLLSPETIPKEYSNWILSASRVPEFAILANRSVVRRNLIEPVQLQRAISYPKITPKNRATLEGILERLKDGWKPGYKAPCEMVHPWCDSCYDTNFRRFFAVFRFMLPVYSALHIIPMLVLRRQHVARDPLRMLAKALWGITRSCSFLGAFVMIYQALFCLRTQSLTRLEDGKSLVKGLLQRKETMWLLGFSTCLSLFAEDKKRRAELAMYVLPKALESAWSSARKRAWVPIVPFGETILGGAAMAMVMDAYKHQPDALSGIVRRLLFQLVGPV